MKTGILGGTFNPVHIGHVRHAVEVGEALGLDRVLLTPCAVPPHKSGQGLLSFALRVDLLRAAVKDIALLEVNTLEGELEGPSYTFDSLTVWRRKNPQASLPFFMLGVEDFAQLATWKRGTDLPQLAHLVVVPRAGSDMTLFFTAIKRLWPHTSIKDEEVPEHGSGHGSGHGSAQVRVPLPGGGVCVFLPVPRLDISASFIRSRWLARRDIRALVPEEVRHLLEARRDEVEPVWREMDTPDTIPGVQDFSTDRG